MSRKSPEMASFSSALHRVGRRIKELRKARDRSQEKLAHDADISRTYMGSVELGAKQPTLFTLFKVAKALGVPLAELFLPPSDEAPKGDEVVSRIHARLLERERTLGEIQKIEDLIEAFLRKGR